MQNVSHKVRLVNPFGYKPSLSEKPYNSNSGKLDARYKSAEDGNFSQWLLQKLYFSEITEDHGTFVLPLPGT